MWDTLSAKLLRLRQKWRNKPRKFSDLRGFSFSVAQRLAMPVFGRRRRQCPCIARAFSLAVRTIANPRALRGACPCRCLRLHRFRARRDPRSPIIIERRLACGIVG
ncbi:hypothetical protein J3J51_00120 [Burkholderia pseudomallei]|uniref:hypothetical protein n=1 Tax=Burkholderia pseudomallei TaxID=28450 RepID=UPI001A9F7825|nr:hypothetical protein [Burkholderia pseudomallei]QTB44963.1 hypothetical protein J3B47_07330 [Burkholderia pseudomallei]QTB69226.1 hypothetical protein J3J51_00120 [Burkholderia pseudomallei]